MKEKQKNILKSLNNRRLYCIIGPSGSGKTTYVAYAKKATGFKEIVSTTTRKPRKKEKDGIDYYFISEMEFNNTEFLECDRYANHNYGTSISEVARAYSHHESAAFAVVTYEGSQKLKKAFADRRIALDVITVFINTPPHLLENRMRVRGDSEELIRQRLENIKKTDEYANASRTDYIFDYSQDMSVEQCCQRFTELICDIENTFIKCKIQAQPSFFKNDPCEKDIK